MCEFGNTVKLKIIGKVVDVDSCIAPLVQMFNDNGIETIASCCGHGKICGNIALTDGRFIDIHQDRKSWGKYSELLNLSKDMMEHINSDIFYKTPRGQIAEGQDVRFHRCTALLALADKINDFIDGSKT